MLRGILSVVPPADVTAIVNVGDDISLHGLTICPDLDTVTYTLANAIDPERGWGLANESWQAMSMLSQYGGIDWFNLGDRDLGTHMYRSQRLAEGASLAQVTAEIAKAWDLELSILPATCDSLRTMVTLSSGEEVSFQEYFVRLAHQVPVQSVRFVGAESARATEGVLAAMESSEVIVIAPSNPIVSIGPLLAISEIEKALRAYRHKVVAVSPIIGGAALKGPADRMLNELGHEQSALGVAMMYREYAAALVIDSVDEHLVPAIEALDMKCVATDTIMKTKEISAALANTVLGVFS